MTFLYNAQWRPAMGHWGGGYSMGAYDPSDYNAEQVQRSMDVGSVFEVLPQSLMSKMTSEEGEERDDTLALKNAIDAAISKDGWEPAKGLLSLDDDEKIYRVHEAIDQINDFDWLKGKLLDYVNAMIKQTTGSRIPDISALRDASYQSYEDFFNATYAEDDEATPDKPPKAPVVNPKTGKVAVPKAKKPPKSSNKMVAIIGGIAFAGLAVWGLSKVMKKGR